MKEEVVLEQERARVSVVNGEERGRESQGTFTDDEVLARLAMARRQRTSRWRRVHERRGCRVCTGEGKGCVRDLAQLL
jgi:hypothetical protein